MKRACRSLDARLRGHDGLWGVAAGRWKRLYSNLLLVVVTFTWFLGQMRDRRGHESK
jgi:hypothetical protein